MTELFAAAIGAIIGLTPFLFERLKTKKAETELTNARRRSEGPLLVAVTMACEGIKGVRPHQGGAQSWVEGDNGDKLFQFLKDESLTSQPTAGAKVSLSVQNLNQKVFSAAIEPPSKYTLEAKFGIIEGPGSVKINYPFDPQRIGQEEKFVLSFQSLSGFKERHVYATIHGKCWLRRVDPD